MDKIERTPEEELDDIIDALNAGKKPVSAGKEVSELCRAFCGAPPEPPAHRRIGRESAPGSAELKLVKSPPAFKLATKDGDPWDNATMLAVIGLSLVPRLLGGDVVLV